jgi:hypothetical protein
VALRVPETGCGIATGDLPQILDETYSDPAEWPPRADSATTPDLRLRLGEGGCSHMERSFMKKVMTGLLGSALLLVSGSVHAQWEQPAGGSIIVVGSGCDYPGFDYSRGSANSAQDCGNQCLADSYCTTFEYNSSNHFCWLKNARAQQKAVGYDGTCGFVATSQGPRWEWDIDRPGNDFASFWTGSPEACQAACSSNSNCGAWNFDSAAAQLNRT